MRLLELLRRVDAGWCHCVPSKGFRGRVRAEAMDLVKLGLLALLPAKGPFPKRFVVTVDGSTAIGTFEPSEEADQ